MRFESRMLCVSVTIAEIYDGECPAESRGCFAQAWSVAELLRAYEDAETAVVFGRNI